LHPRSLLLLVVFCLPLHAQPTVVATVADPGLRERYWGVGIESVCGDDWLLYDDRPMCARRDLDGRLTVTSLAPIPGPGPGLNIVRGPVDQDRRFLLGAISGGALFPFLGYAMDPVTGVSEYIGNLPLPTIARTPTLIDYDGDGVSESLLAGIGGGVPPALIAMPGSPQPLFQIVQQLPSSTKVAGRFDADPAAELAVIDGNLLRLYDAVSLQQEAFSAAGWFDPAGVALAADWDGDGIDEIALPEYFDSGVGLVDPNGSSQVLAGARNFLPPKRPLGIVDWSGQNARELVVLASNGVQIIDPRTGATIASFPVAASPGEQNPLHARAIDWDDDGDQDFIYIGSDTSTLNLLRNPQGLEVLQLGALAKQPLGTVQSAGQPQLLALEHFGPVSAPTVRVRTRDPATLALLDEAVLESAPGPYAQWQLAELHASAGPELLSVEADRLRAHSSTSGALLWQQSPQPNRRLASAVAAKMPCSGANCRWIALLDESLGATQPRVRILDGADGGELATPIPEVDQGRVLALSDLDDDGVPDLLAWTNSTSSRLQAFRGADWQLLWQQPLEGGETPAQVVRTEDADNRLAVLYDSGLLAYHDPASGQMLRSAMLRPASGGSPCLSQCRLGYVMHGPRSGTFVYSLINGPITGIDRSLRGAAQSSQNNSLSAFGLAVTGKWVSLGGLEVMSAVEFPQEGLFADSLEGW